jgi:hypothetical protein
MIGPLLAASATIATTIGMTTAALRLRACLVYDDRPASQLRSV